MARQKDNSLLGTLIGWWVADCEHMRAVARQRTVEGTLVVSPKRHQRAARRSESQGRALDSSLRRIPPMRATPRSCDSWDCCAKRNSGHSVSSAETPPATPAFRNRGQMLSALHPSSPDRRRGDVTGAVDQEGGPASRQLTRLVDSRYPGRSPWLSLRVSTRLLSPARS